jgi:polyisoprenyl-phosphate glycosyltransferase
MVMLNLVIPCFNEEEALPQTIPRVRELLDQLVHDGEVEAGSGAVFVDDGSSDATWRTIAEWHARDERIRGIKLSRNQGHQHALLAGLLNAEGDVLISMDADLQDDLEAIPRMLAEHKAGADIVFGVRSNRDSDTFFKRTTAQAYYRVLGKLGTQIVPDHADFRLMSRRALSALEQFSEVNLFLRGVIPLLGLRTARVEYVRHERVAGVSKYPFAKMAALAFDGITSFSARPLQWAIYVGAFLSFASMLAGLWAIVIRVFTDQSVPGWASTVIPMYFLGGVQLLFLGVIGGYVAKIYAETKRRPRFIIEEKL